MARTLGSIVKMSRREGFALHPKAVKAMAKRSTVPGQHGRTVRKNMGQFNAQLREKQKVKRIYGLLEKQFARLMVEANRTQGQSGSALLQFLERRLDNAVYRAGFAVSRRASRQLVTHGHFMVNGRRVDVPSIRLKMGDVVELRAASKTNEYFKQLDEVSPGGNEGSLSWLAVERKKVSFKVTGLPTREEAELEIHEQLIVEYYSR
jgi:small subunit ribosomal protein S4